MAERKTVRRWFWVYEFEKEEEWLCSMAMEGWVLDKVGFCRYEFVRCEPGEYTVRLEMHDPDKDYLSFMDEIGAEYIGRMASWIYFRRKAELGEFDLFSDVDSKIEHLEKIGKLLSIVGAANIVIGLANTFNVINIGFINLLLGCVLMYCLGRIHGKTEDLKRERTLHE